MNNQNKITPQQQKAVRGILQKIEPLRKEVEAFSGGMVIANVPPEQESLNFIASNLSKIELLDKLEAIKSQLQIIYNVCILEPKPSNYHEQLILDLERHVNAAYERIKILG